MNKIQKSLTDIGFRSTNRRYPKATDAGLANDPALYVEVVDLGSGGTLADGNYGDVTVASSGTAITVNAGAITNADLANAAANTYKANATASAAAPQDVAVAANQLVGRGASGNLGVITLGTNLSMSGTTLNAASGGSSIVTTTVNGGRFSYIVLSGIPVLTFDKSNPLAPTLTVAGGTIRLVELRDTITTGSSVNPVYTLNATWADALDTAPSNVMKVSVSSGQYNIANTPQTIVGTTGTTQCVVTFNGVASDTRFIISWNNI